MRNNNKEYVLHIKYAEFKKIEKVNKKMTCWKERYRQLKRKQNGKKGKFQDGSTDIDLLMSVCVVVLFLYFYKW